MISPFRVWTRLELKRNGHDSSLNVSVGRAGWRSTNVCLPVRYPGSPQRDETFEPHAPDAELSEGECHQVMTRAVARYGCDERHFGIGLIAKDNLKYVDWAKLGNGAAFVFPRENLTKMGAEPIGDELCVHVIPLPLMGAVARFTVKGASGFSAVDFRAFYVYGLINKTGQNFDWKKPDRIQLPEDAAVKTMYPRQQWFVYNGKLVDHEQYCTKICPRKIQWTLDQCHFMTHNCSVATDLDRGMLSAPDPDYAAMFGEDVYRKLVDCVHREEFEPYDASGLMYELDALTEEKEIRKGSAEQGAITRRLKKRMCTDCWLGQEGGSGGPLGACEAVRPAKCAGPFFDEEITHLPGFNAWEMEVLYHSSNGTTIPIRECRKLLPDYLYGRSAKVVVLRPWNARTLVIDVSTMRLTKAAEKSTRRVILCLNLRAGMGLDFVVSYKEFCQLFGLTEKKSWKALKQHYMSLRNVRRSVLIAIRNLLAQQQLQLYNFFVFTLGEGTVGFTNNGGWLADWHNQASPQQLYNVMSGAPMGSPERLPNARRDENEHIHELIVLNKSKLSARELSVGLRDGSIAPVV